MTGSPGAGPASKGRAALSAISLVTALIALAGPGTDRASVAEAAEAETADTCLECHLELDDEVLTPPAQMFADDVHRKSGFTCASCHGGDPRAEDSEASMSSQAGFVGVPDALAIPSLCARCHSDENMIRRFNPALPVDQEAKYKTSGHGKALIGGDRKVAHCASCHGAHGIRPASDPGSPVYATRLPQTCDSCHGDKALMSGYGIDSDPYEEYELSVHGQALLERGDIGAPACNDCHGSHGAAPPGVDAVHFVCGTCHLNNREQFETSPHAQAFADLGEAECLTCHGYHSVMAPSDAHLGVGDQATCRQCHDDESDAGYMVAARLGAMVDSLRNTIEGARTETERAEQVGMLVDDATFQIGTAHEHLVKMRTESHAASPDAMADDYHAGIEAARAALADASGRIEESHFRRRGLIVATLLNTALIGFVLLSVRRLSRRPKPPPSSG
jgi:hypothetical protein